MILANLWRAGCVGLGALCLFLATWIWGVPLIGGGLLAKLDHSRQAIALLEKDIGILKGNETVLKQAVSGCSARTEAMEAALARQTAEAEKALREAQKANSRADEAIGRIRARQAQGCGTGAELEESGL